MITGRIHKPHASFLCTIPMLLCKILELSAGDEISFTLVDENRKLLIAPVKAARPKTGRNEANGE